MADDPVHVLNIVFQTSTFAVALKQRGAHAHSRQRCAQIVRQAGQHFALFGLGPRQLRLHGVVVFGQMAHFPRPLGDDRMRPAIACRRDRRIEPAQRADDAAHKQSGDER